LLKSYEDFRKLSRRKLVGIHDIKKIKHRKKHRVSTKQGQFANNKFLDLRMIKNIPDSYGTTKSRDIFSFLGRTKSEISKEKVILLYAKLILIINFRN
jgi:hypothetical protein